MKFIELTTIDNKKIYINSLLILTMNDEEDGSYIRIWGNYSYTVKETIKEIIQKIESYETIRKVINVEVPKEIWDAEQSVWNVIFMRKDIMGAWMKSIKDVVNQIKH